MLQIVDHNGQPINTGLLKTTIATPTTTGVRQIIASASHGLDPELLGHMLRQAVNGDASAYLRLAEDMEEKYLHYGSELSTRKRALVGLELYVEPAGDDAVSQRAAELVEQALAPIKENLFDILDAIGKGFSVHEIDWETSVKQWMPVGLSYLQPYWLQIRREEPETLYLRSDSNIYGEALAPYKFITHKVKAKSGVLIRGGLARMACWAFLFSNYAIKDWVTFAEAYGQPLRVGKYDVSATPQDIETLLMALRSLGTDAAAAIPKNMEIDFVDAGNKTASVDIYARLTEYFDKQTSKIVLGQTLSTNTGGADGGGAYALGKVHNEVREDILDADVQQLEATLSRDYVKPIVDLNMGVQSAYPSVKLRINKAEDLATLAGVVDTLVRAGLPVSQESTYARFGLERPKQGEAILVPVDAPAQQAMNRYRAMNALQPGQTADPMAPLLEQLTGKTTDPMEATLQVIRQALADASDLESFQAWLTGAFGDLPVDQLQRVMNTAFSLAELSGRYEVSNGR
jgi:phage gp29-like protein